MKKIVPYLLASLFAGVASATPITTTSVFTSGDKVLNFDEVALASGTLISNQYAAYGVVFTGGIYRSNGGYSSANHVSGSYLDSFSGGGHTNFWSIDFSSIQTSAGAYFEVDSDNSLVLTAMLGGNVVESFSFSDGICCTTMAFAGFTGINFDSLRFTTSLSNGRNFYMDELHYTSASTSSVPAPTSIMLLGLGLAGVGLSRKRKAS